MKTTQRQKAELRQNKFQRMEDALQLIEFSQATMSCKSIPSNLNRKRKLSTKPGMHENQENPEVVVVYEVLAPESPRSPLKPIPIGSNHGSNCLRSRKNLSSAVPKIKSKLQLRESWKR